MSSNVTQISRSPAGTYSGDTWFDPDNQAVLGAPVSARTYHAFDPRIDSDVVRREQNVGYQTPHISQGYSASDMARNYQRAMAAQKTTPYGVTTLSKRPGATIHQSTPSGFGYAFTPTNMDASQSSTGNDFEYNWQALSGGNIVIGADGPMPTVDAPGIYELLITNITNGCNATLEVEVGQDIMLPTASAGIDFVLPCFEPSTALNGNGSSVGTDFEYSWSTNDGNLVSGTVGLTPLVDEPGTYHLTVSNTSNGCESEDEVTIIQEIPTASTDFTEPLCYGDLGNIFVSNVQGGVSPYVYSIDGGGSYYQSSTFPGLEPGAYEVVVQDINGCEYEEEIIIQQPDSMVVLLNPRDMEIQLGDMEQLFLQVNIADTSIASITWSEVPGLSCYDCLDPIASPNQTTSYVVRVVSKEGCMDDAFVRIVVNKEGGVYIPNGFSPNGDGTNDIFFVFARSEAVRQVNAFKVFNRWGESMFEAYDFQPNNPANGWDGQFRGQPLNPGVFVYFAEIEFTDGRVEIFKGDVTLVK